MKVQYLRGVVPVVTGVGDQTHGAAGTPYRGARRGVSALIEDEFGLGGGAEPSF